MKKRMAWLIIALLMLIWPATAFAEGDAESAATLSIDDEHIYVGMNASYSTGYSPTVGSGVATIILPLVSSSGVSIGDITATPGLGDTSSSPFVYSNYQKTVTFAENTLSDGSTYPCYLVKFELPLANNRVNGVYPVTIDVSGSGIQSASFTTYVTITDGENPNAEPTPGATAAPVSQPKVIVSNSSVNPSPVLAGEEFSVTITLQNTSKKRYVKNMTVTVSCDSQNFLLLDDSDTIYIDKLAKGDTTQITLHYKTGLETQPGRYQITLSMEYDNSDAETLSSSGSVTITVTQPLRVELETPTVPESVNAGDTMPLSFQVMNMGRCAVYNVRVTLSAPGLIPTETAFIGNMDAGTAATADMNVFVGTKTMTEGYEGDDKYGFTNGVITLIYEDEAGEEYTAKTDFYTTINEPVISASSNELEEEPEMAGQWWISLLVGGVVIAALVIILILRKKKEKHHEEL